MSEQDEIHPQVAKAVQLAGGDDALDDLLAAGRSMPAGRIADLNARLRDPAQLDGAIRELQTHRSNGRETDRMVAAGQAGSTARFAMGGLGVVERERREAGDPLYRAVPAPATSKHEFRVLMERAQRGDALAKAAVRATPTERIMAWG